MSRDLIFKTLKKSWARDDFTYKPSLAPAASTPKLVPTPEESARLKKLSDLRSRAESGDEKSKKEWRAAHTRVVALRVRARGGDPKAIRACQVLEQSGVFGKSQKTTVSGSERPSREFVGRQEIMGSDDVFGEFVGDEERLARDAGPTERAASARISGPFSAIASRFARKGKRGHQGRRLSKLAWRASRGDAAAAAKLQQVTTRLQQRASSGDARATALLQKVQAVQARAQAQAQAAQQVAPTAAPTYAPPPAAPAPVANVTYSAPYASSDESEYVEEEY
jgi:hypothetical protein